jgi:purine-binding chemotaxis protein CheW
VGHFSSRRRNVRYQCNAGAGSAALYRNRAGAGRTELCAGHYVVTVLDTRDRFGLPESEISEQTRIVIIEAEKHVIGIMVDAVAEVVYLRQSEIETAPNVGNEDNAKFIQGVCHKNNELLILVELDRLLTDEEWADLDDI